MAKRPITAREVLKRLEDDPEYQDREAEREAQLRELRAELDEDQRFLVEEISREGYGISSVWDLVNNQPHEFLETVFVGPYPRAYPILLRHLRVSHHPRVREGIIRALTVKDGGRDVEEALLEQFDVETDRSLRWVLANALQTAMPYHRRRKYSSIKAVLDIPRKR